MVGLIEQMMTGRASSPIVMSFHMKCDLYMASQGYPGKMSSFPMFIM